MFAENNQISGRQLFRLLFFELLGLSSLILPGAIAGNCGRNGSIALLAGGIVVFAYLLLLERVLRQPGSYQEKLQENFGVRGQKCIYLIYGLGLVLGSAYVLVQFGNLIQISLLKDEQYGVIIALIQILVLYSAYYGIEGRSRVFEILFWILVIPLLVAFLLACRDLDYYWMIPLWNLPAENWLKGMYLSLTGFSILGMLPFFKGYCNAKSSLGKIGKRAFLLVFFILFLMFLILLGTFGGASMGKITFPVVTLMSIVKIPGGFLKQQNAFMTAIWFFMVFALLTGSVFFTGFCWNIHKKARHGLLKLTVVVVVISLLAYWMHTSGTLYQWIETAVLYGLVPFLYLMPLFAWQKKALRVLPIMFCLGLAGAVLTGCSAQELENRNFPLAVGVDYQKEECITVLGSQDMSESSKQDSSESSANQSSTQKDKLYTKSKDFQTGLLEKENSGNKELDTNHVKVLLIGEKFLEEQKQMNQLMMQLQQEEWLPRNTLVFTCKDVAEVFAVEDSIGTPLGTYLEEMMENQKNRKQTGLLTIGDLWNDYYNKEELFLVPVLSTDTGLPAVTGYYAIDCMEMKGEITQKEGEIALLCQNELKQLILETPSGESVQLENLKTVWVEMKERRQKNSQTGRWETVNVGRLRIHAENKAGIEEAPRESVALNWEEALIHSVEKTIQNLQKEPGIDITESYHCLPAYQEALYQAYQRNKKEWDTTVEIQIQIESKESK